MAGGGDLPWPPPHACTAADAAAATATRPATLPMSGSAACECLTRRGIRGIYTFGDCIARDMAQRLAQLLNEGSSTLDLRSSSGLGRRHLWRLRCSPLLPHLVNFTSDIRYTGGALGPFYADAKRQLQAAGLPPAVSALAGPSSLVCGGRAAVIHTACMQPNECRGAQSRLQATLHAANHGGGGGGCGSDGGGSGDGGGSDGGGGGGGLGPSAFPADVVVVTLGVHVAERAPPVLLSRIYDDVVAQLQRASADVMARRGQRGQAAQPRAHRRRGPINIVAGYHAGLRAGGDGGGGDGASSSAERAHAYLRQHADGAPGRGADSASDSLGIKRLNSAARGAVERASASASTAAYGGDAPLGAATATAAEKTTEETADVRYLDLFCSTSDVLTDAAASSDGLHFSDAIQWRKAQLLLAEVCRGGGGGGGGGGSGSGGRRGGTRG